MSDNLKKYDKFFKLIGESVWHLQHVENAISTYLSLKNSQPNKQEVMDSLNKLRSFTLGQAITFGEHNNLIPPLMLFDLKEFKDERNWLIHKSIYQNHADIFDKKQHKQLFNRLTSFIRKAIFLYKVIAKDLDGFVADSEKTKKYNKMLTTTYAIKT